MTQSRPEPKVIVIPAKEESPQDQEKKKNLRVLAVAPGSRNVGKRSFHGKILSPGVFG